MRGGGGDGDDMHCHIPQGTKFSNLLCFPREAEENWQEEHQGKFLCLATKKIWWQKEEKKHVEKHPWTAR